MPVQRKTTKVTRASAPKQEKREHLPLITGEDEFKFEYEVYVRRYYYQQLKVRVLASNPISAEFLAKEYAMDHKDEFKDSLWCQGDEWDSEVLKARQLTKPEIKELQQKIRKKDKK